MKNVKIDVLDFAGLADFAGKEELQLTLVGPELPLAGGVCDHFRTRGLKIIGPGKSAAKIESSKFFAKQLMRSKGVPTANFWLAKNPKEAEKLLEQGEFPMVIKEDGLAAGKGVTVVDKFSVGKALIKRHFAKSNSGPLLFEEFIEGEEGSYIVYADGERFVPMASSQDHKRAFDGDNGPNTGGMGAYSPYPPLDGELSKRIDKQVIAPILKGLKEEGKDYSGFLYAGLIIDSSGEFKVLEFNCRFGDPEAQAIMPRLKSDFAELLLNLADGKLPEKLSWHDQSCLSVVVASKGYPGSYSTGEKIKGLDKSGSDGTCVFFSGCEFREGSYYSSGGRVLTVSALGSDLAEAKRRCYSRVKEISWNNCFYRKDIGDRSL